MHHDENRLQNFMVLKAFFFFYNSECDDSEGAFLFAEKMSVSVQFKIAIYF